LGQQGSSLAVLLSRREREREDWHDIFFHPYLLKDTAAAAAAVATHMTSVWMFSLSIGYVFHLLGSVCPNHKGEKIYCEPSHTHPVLCPREL
jgi:hypothetical protein